MWRRGLEPCCGKPEHRGRLVCGDIRGCVDIVLARLHAQAAEVALVVSGFSVSGRSEPRQPPVADDFRHDVRFFRSDRGGIYAECRPCQWRIWVDDGHTAADFAELERQHCGLPAPSSRVDASTAGESSGEVRQQLAEIRLTLDAFDWAAGDAQFALKQIDDVVNGADR